MFRKALLILSGNAVEAILLLVRNLLIARLIPVDDYGIAATLVLAVAVVEMASALGLQQQLVQAHDGDSARLQAALQGFQLLRGTLSAIALFAMAGPIAAFMNLPEVTWGYRAVALVPLINSLAHFDVHRLSRSLNFRPMFLARVAPASIGLLCVWPFVAWFGDWRAMLCAILLQSALVVTTTHLVAERPYRLVLDRATMAQSLSFGWPLLLNGGLLFLVYNGDRVVVGRELGMVALGVFSMGVTLTLTPTLILERSVQSVVLPRLSRIRPVTPEGAAEFLRVATLATAAMFAVGLTFLVATAAVGGPVVHLLLGARYADLPPLLPLLAAVQVMRVAKAMPSVLALATGHTGNALASNFMRVASFPFVWLAVSQTGELTALLWIALAAEAAGYGVAAVLAHRSAPGWLRVTLTPHLGAAALMAVVLIVGFARPANDSLDPTAVLVMVLVLCLYLCLLGDLWRHLWHRAN